MLSLFTRNPRMAALIAGLASATGFAPLGLWPVTLIALAVLMHLVQQAATAKRAFLLGWLFGFGHFTLSLNWIATAFTFQAAMPPILGWVAVPLVSLYLALYPALACAAAWWVWRWISPPLRHSREGGSPSPKDAAPDGPEMDSRFHGNDENNRGKTLPFRGEVGGGANQLLHNIENPPSQPSPLKGRGLSASFILLFAAAWIISEWLRSWLFTGFAWNPLGAILISTILPAYAAYIGTYGLAAVPIGMAALMTPAAKWLTAFRPSNIRRIPSGSWVVIGFVAIFGLPVVVLVLFPSVIGIDRPFQVTSSAVQGTPVTIVQPNIGQGDKWDLTQRLDNFERLAALSRPHGPAHPRLLLWPEAAVPDYLEDGTPADWAIEEPARVRARLAALLGPDDLLLTGAVRLEMNAARTDIAGARNALFTLNARGQLGPRYDKAHLVPYGEYLPMRSLLEPLGLSRLAPGAVDFWPGPGARTLNLGRFGKVGIQICYEIIFSGQVVDRANRPTFIFNPSNDAWFGSWGPPQHLAQARLRAIEEGLPVVRATPTGISAIIDADGRVVEAVPMHVAGRIDATLPPPHAPTLFARYGNILPLAFAVFLVGLGVAFGCRRG